MSCDRHQLIGPKQFEVLTELGVGRWSLFTSSPLEGMAAVDPGQAPPPDHLVASEGEPDLVQLSGGEPTLHPQFFDILDAAKRRPIRHLMINTNGLRIAREDGFAERLAEYMPGFEVYLQFDSLKRAALMELRGADLAQPERKAGVEDLVAGGLACQKGF